MQKYIDIFSLTYKDNIAIDLTSTPPVASLWIMFFLKNINHLFILFVLFVLFTCGSKHKRIFKKEESTEILKFLSFIKVISLWRNKTQALKIQKNTGKYR